ncbi:serine/threonine-protein kinase [uncultured Mycolicibacterium sp.]|uniref:serine/threonine-protein kinase n=1 Tax=uncultured Mycolicibacterium sp. TaxID=2320817 RepID=UPI00260BB047|nr:serine/threonine-protein kinase [uncultured Mycolicibacterium sp.]
MLPVGSVVAGYRIEGVLGTGGMGTVYLARNPTLPRHDALKVLRPELSGDPGFRDRFTREAEVAAVLDHPNIVSIHARGQTDDGQLWVAMQYVPGTDAERALRDGRMTPARAVHIVGEVARALDYAHRHRVVHHDVKPANFLLSPQPTGAELVRLGDFGVPHTLAGAGAGAGGLVATPAYTAPEVLAGGPVDGRADLYSLGCSLYRLLSGHKPVPDTGDAAAVIRAHLYQEPPPLSHWVPWSTPQLDAVLARALAKDPAQRFGSAREFADAAAQAVYAALAGPAGAAPPSRPPARRRLLVGAAAAAVVLVAGAGAALWWLRPGAPSLTETATPTADLAAENRLLGMLPPGYADGACRTDAPPEGAAARVVCGHNADPGGPPSATYTLARDAGALRVLFDGVVASARTVICPGNIQSPGPWRRLAAPDRPVGTLFCGMRPDGPVVAWTDDAKRTVSEVRSGPGGPSLADLYAWWSSHS